MKNFVQKNSIWICLIISISLTIFIIRSWVIIIENVPRTTDETQAIAIALIFMSGVFFISFWAFFGWLFDKIFK